MNDNSLERHLKAYNLTIEEGKNALLAFLGAYSEHTTLAAVHKKLFGSYHITEQNTGILAEEPAVSYGVLDATAGINKGHLLAKINDDESAGSLMAHTLAFSGLPLKTLAERVFEVSPKTLASYKDADKQLPVRFKEVILHLEQLYQKGTELFGSAKQFNKWLHHPAYGLGGVMPITMVNSTVGIALILEELIRIEFGATA